MSEKNSTDKTLEHLLSKLVDETIAVDEWALLEQRLAGDPEAQRHYLRYLDLHSELIRNGEEDSPSIDHVPVRKNRRWIGTGLAAAALIILASLVFFNGDAKPQSVVQVIAGGGPVEWEGWDGETKMNPQSGLSLAAGTIETLAAESWIELQFPDDTSASLSGPSVLTISLVNGRKVLRLKKGNLSVDAAKQPEGLAMQIHTPSAEAEVVGTRFNIAADSFSTQLTVNEGKVRMTRLADGKVSDVSANEELVAALEKGTRFTAAPRRIPVRQWKSVIPRDAIQGTPEKSSSGIEGIRASPHIWKGEPNRPREPILLYSAVFDPSPRKSPPLQIGPGSRVEIRGRMTHSERIHPGIATNLDRGGFAGKYAVSNGAKVELDEKGQFIIELPISFFIPTNARFPETPVGQEMMYLWINTVKSDAGLVIEGVELKQ